MSSCNTTTPEFSTYEGVWRSLGSGTLLHIQGPNYQYYDVMHSSCLPRRSGPLSDFADDIQLELDTLKIKLGINTYYYIRSKALPSFCLTQSANPHGSDPIYNFEIFAQNIAEHYAFFDLNQINWDSLYTTQKAKLHANSSEADLYITIEETFEALRDNHAFLEAPDEVYEQMEANQIEEPEETSSLKEYGDFQIADLVINHYLVEDLTKDSWLIKWGKMENNIGFVQIKAMWLYADLNLSDSLIKVNGLVDTYVDAFHQLYEGNYIKKEVMGVRNIMDQIMADLNDTDAMILDVRFNGGGQDAVSLEILRRFNDQKQEVATQKLRYGNQFSPINKIYLKAAEHPYLNPVFVLTSPQTGSAAESFALTTLSMPHVHRIGSATLGALSTALEKKLPNGWDYALSNEIYTDTNGRYYENVGIPVDYELNYPRDRQTFFRYVANNLEKDKQQILDGIHELLNE